MPRLINKLKAKLSRTESGRNSQVHPSAQPNSPTEPNAVPAVLKPPTGIVPIVEQKPLQGRLWNEAYELLKSSNAELVASYEKVLSRELLRGQHGNTESASSENRIDAEYGERWRQMYTVADAALRRQEEKVAKKQKIGAGLAAVSTAMRQALRTVPEAAVAWTGVCLAFEMISNSIQEAKANQKGMVYVISRMDWYWHLPDILLEGDQSEPAPSALRDRTEKHIVDLYHKLLLYQMKSVCRYYRQHGSVLWRDAIKTDDWTGQLDDIRHAEAIVQEETRAFNGLEIHRRLAEIDRSSRILQSDIQGFWPKLQERILSQDEERCLKDLRVTDPRDDKSRIELTNGGLLQGVYGWAIKHDDFVAWRDGKEKHLLWIKGDPGKGKTMLVCGIIDELQILDIRPCYFFCQATDPRLNTATAVLRGLIYLLVDTNRQLLPHIQEKYDQAGTALFQDANSWVVLSQMFTKLLEDPSLDGQVFIIDALDECQTDLERLLDLIVGKSANPHAKWIVSSRNWTTIEAKLGAASQKIRFSLELNEQSVAEAICVFVSQKAAQLRVAKGLDEEMERKVQSYLTDNARGTFLWVALVCKELSRMGVRKRHVMKKMAEFPPDLGPLYERMMQQIRESEDSDLCEKILLLAAIVYRPVTLAELASLLDIEDDFSDEDLEEIVASCGSFLVVRDSVVRFVHQSAQDFLLKDKTFAPRLGSQHYAVFLRSMEILSATLRRDMYNLRYPGVLIEEQMPNQQEDVLRHARYSCVCWADHLKAVNDLEKEKCVLSLQKDGIIHRFLNNKLLNWLEACSLIGGMTDATRMVGTLRGLTTSNTCEFQDLIEDAYRFVLSHRIGIGLAPSQIYSSALIFSPTCSLVRQRYEETEGPEWIVKLPFMPSEWTARLQCLEGHKDIVTALAFSRDGTQLASGSVDHEAKVWDIETGVCLHTFSCHDAVRSTAFSPGGEYLATGSNGAVEVWNLTTATISSMFRVPACTDWWDLKDMHLTFSTDGTRLAASCNGWGILSFIRSWDVGTGMELKSHSLGHNMRCHTAFAPDGTQLAGVVDKQNKQIHIWNLSTDVHLSPRTFDVDEFEEQRFSWAADFSLDASRLAMAPSRCIHILDASTGNCLQEFGKQSEVFDALKFLTDPKSLMSASGGGCYRIWDITTGACLRQLNCDSLSACNLAVPSPDGTLIADLSGAAGSNYQIELWDMAMSVSTKASKKLTDVLWKLLFSPDGKHLALAFFSEEVHSSTIELWDSTNGACLMKFETSGQLITSLAFFPDGQRLASGGAQSIDIWDVFSGVRLQSINVESVISTGPGIGSIALSSDGSLLAAASMGPPVFGIWDTNSAGSLQWSNDGTKSIGNEIVAVAFSPDDARIELASRSGSVHIYDVSTGTALQTFGAFFFFFDR